MKQSHATEGKGKEKNTFIYILGKLQTRREQKGDKALPQTYITGNSWLQKNSGSHAILFFYQLQQIQIQWDDD